MPSSKKRKADTVHPVAKEKCESPPRKSRLVGPAFGMPPQESLKLGETSQEDCKAPMGQENVKEEEYIFKRATNITLDNLANIVEEFQEN